jgi:hypothetical protein
MRIAVRCYMDNAPKPQMDSSIPYNENLVFVFDTETTTDQYQDLLFGSYGIWENDRLKEFGVFHENGLDQTKLDILSDYAKKKHTKLITKSEFLELFMEYVYKRRAICIGFNLPFDISRVALKYGISRNRKDANGVIKSNKNAFSFKLSDNILYPRITIEHIDSKRALINFTNPYAKNFRHFKKFSKFQGIFVDLRMLAFALTDDTHSLESACELFKVEHKKFRAEEHGKITPEYIQYNMNDVFATYDLFIALKNEFAQYHLPTPLNKLFSPASLGKEYFKEMRIMPFLERNPDFPKSTLGWIMTTYYGGRTEVHMRKKPVKVSYIDFTSMYPTMFVLLGLWDFVISDNIDVTEDNKFVEFVKTIKLNDLTNKGIWKKLNGIALIEPDKDILPLRAKYGNKTAYNIGLNYAEGKGIWYAYPDIIASILLTGKVPRIVKAYNFVPKGKQKDLKTVNLLGKELQPAKEDFIRYLIEHRLEVKKKLEVDPTNSMLEKEAFIAKIIANTAAYGIFVEVNTVNEKCKVSAYGLDHRICEVKKTERFGRAFNPILATTLTAGSRLVLAMVEAFVKERGGYFAYCDTDALFINPELVGKVQAFFNPLNPYSIDVNLFKVEKNDDRIRLHDVWFYAISAKRYCLYELDENGSITILKHSSHGLGGILGMGEQEAKDVWIDILNYHYGKLSKEALEQKYSDKYVMGKLALTSPFILRRFKKINQDSRIKPFNFVIVGIGYRTNPSSNESVIPMIPFTKKIDQAPYAPFVDYKTGVECKDNTKFYWKPLSEYIFDYMNHNDNKYDGDIGELKRKHVFIDGVDLIGKESNNLEQSEVIGVSDDDYVIYDNKTEQKIMNVIRNMTIKQAKEIGISRRNLFYLKKRAKCGRRILLKKKTLLRLSKVL